MSLTRDDLSRIVYHSLEVLVVPMASIETDNVHTSGA